MSNYLKSLGISYTIPNPCGTNICRKKIVWTFRDLECHSSMFYLPGEVEKRYIYSVHRCVDKQTFLFQEYLRKLKEKCAVSIVIRKGVKLGGWKRLFLPSPFPLFRGKYEECIRHGNSELTLLPQWKRL